MRVMVLGDTHGDCKWAESVTKIAGRHHATTVLQVGDFGYWPRMLTGSKRPHSEAFLETIAKACERHGVDEWIVIDGNHDDHAELAKRRAEPGDPDGLIRLGAAVRYSPRGHHFHLGGACIGTLGGAVSLDAWAEEAGYEFGGTPYERSWDWFPDDEAPTFTDVERLALDGTVDLLLTHDCPAGIDMARFDGFKGIAFEAEVEARCRQVRDLVAAAAIATEAPLLVHGHWHARYTTFLELPHHLCQVEGLASNSRNRGRDGRAYLFIDICPSLSEAGVKLNVVDGRQLAKLAD